MKLGVPVQRILARSLPISALALGVIAANAAPAPAGGARGTGHLVVALRPGTTATSPAWRARAARYGLTDPRPVFRGHEDWGISDWTATAPNFDITRVAADLQAAP